MRWIARWWGRRVPTDRTKCKSGCVVVFPEKPLKKRGQYFVYVFWCPCGYTTTEADEAARHTGLA